ncbi:MAG: CoB--CoM heterodisulfide reductase iron-sulfur subunit A family protein, partial [Desulfofustis sp.]|nr:CoB--CoM heterodisulfide reductase iron-sulfur subunit A family protein [Desulfofustis sp.]
VPERSVVRREPRIGVFICCCGTNIGAVVRVPEVAAFAKTLPHVVYVEENLFTCSQDTQDKLAEVIRDQDLNRVVIAACTPITHESLFQETLINAGLNKYLIEMANIRNHDSWIHADQPDAATAKAKDLVRMAIAKAALLDPLWQKDLPVTRSALVVGGGIAGMTAALALANQGYPVVLVETSELLGGQARNIYRTSKQNDVAPVVADLIEQVLSDQRITVYTGSEVAQVKGFVGNFETEISHDDTRETIRHGVAVIATGAEEYKPTEYLYGSHAAVLTHLEMDELLKHDDPKLMSAQVAVFIQCVGSREPMHPYCSKVCCTHTMVSALELKKKNPDMTIIVLYRDIRTYGTREALYREARAEGILFCRYSVDQKPVVTPAGEQVNVSFDDPILGRRCVAEADILCLATAIKPRSNEALTRLFKIPCDEDGWLLEAHQKLRPVEFATEGIFLCGMDHYPKPIDESIVQAKAAASRALSVLSRERIHVGGMVPTLDERLCSGCRGCVNVCSYGAISFNETRHVAEINEALCKGCGACAAACPSEALVLKGFSHRQIYAQIEGALHVETAG